MKTTSLRIDDQRHAQLLVLSQLQETSITEIILSAIDAYIEARRNDPGLAGQAEAVLADIDREAANRRSAIATLFGETEEPSPQRSSRGRKVASTEQE